MRARSLGLLSLLLAAPLVVTLASAQSTTGSVAPVASAAGSASSAPAISRGNTGPGPYSPKLQKGNAAYVARDFQGAIAAYREAIQEDAKDPLGYYLLGEAQLAAGNIAEAEASWQTGLRSVGSAENVQAKLLFVMADLRERQGKWADAKKAWDEYAQFLSTHPGAKGYAATATERNKAIDTHNDLETKYAAVKQRIEQRLKETTAPPPDTIPAPTTPAGKTPAAGKKK